MSSSVLGVMECVCGPVSCHCRRCFCVSESDDGRALVRQKIFYSILNMKGNKKVIMMLAKHDVHVICLDYRIASTF